MLFLVGIQFSDKMTEAVVPRSCVGNVWTKGNCAYTHTANIAKHVVGVTVAVCW
jgi:hypothetical protein